MKLLELAKRNLIDYVNVIELIEYIASEHETPTDEVALFLLNQKVDTELSSYECNSSYLIFDHDHFNHGHFTKTLALLNDVKDHASIIYDQITIDYLVNEYKNYYWKISEILDLQVFKELNVSYYIQRNMIQQIVKYRGHKFHLFERETLNKSEIAQILSGVTIHPYDSPEKTDKNYLACLKFINDSEVLSLTSDYSTIGKEDFIVFLNSQNIVIDGYNIAPVAEPEQAKYVWDTQYTSLVSNEMAATDKDDNHKSLEFSEPDPVDNDFDNSLSEKLSNIERQFESCKKVMATQKENLDQLRERVAELEEENRVLSENIESIEPDKILATKSYNSVLKFICVLVEMAKVNTINPFSDYESLKTQSDLIGLEKFPSKDTVADWLKAVNHLKEN